MAPPSLQGPYTILSELGQGAMGTVYLVREEGRAEPVALKLLSIPEFSESGLRHFEEEFKTLTGLAHPNLTEVYDFGRAKESADGREVPFFTMEHVKGSTLDRFLRGPDLDYRTLYDCFAQVGQALAYLHARGLVHQDVKPSNILVADDAGRGPRVKLMDLGLAARPRAGDRPASIRGTAAYLSPEAARGGPVDPRSDLYSLGCVAYEIVTGHPPFHAGSALEVLRGHLLEEPIPPSTLKRGIPPAFEALVLRMLAKDPGRRPSSADRFLEMLNEIAGGILAVATPETRRHRVLGGGFVGREAELTRLTGALDEVRREGAGRVLLVVGEAGVGKTRLLREFQVRCQIAGCDFFPGRAEPGAVSGGALSEALARAIRARGPLAVETLRRHRPALEGLLGGGGPVEESQEPPPRAAAEERFLLLTAVSAAVEDLLRPGPLVLALDDLHLADETTIALLRHLARGLWLASQEGRPSPLLLVGTYRGEEVSRASPLFDLLAEARQEGTAEELFLEPLGPAEAASLLRAMLGADEVPLPWLERILERTGGNPLFIGELMALLAEEGHVAPGSGARPDPATLSRVELPERIRDLLARRYERLTAEARELLQAAAILGGATLDPDALATVTGKRWDHVVRQLLDLLGSGILLREADDEGTPVYRLAHPSLAALALERGAAQDRRLLHARALAYLERKGVQNRHGAWAAFARHAEGAGQPGRAIEAWGRAGDLARDLYAQREAIELYGRAIDLALKKGEAAAGLVCGLYERRSLAHGLAGDLARAEEDARWMLARAEKAGSDPLRSRAHLGLGRVLASRSQLAAAQESLEVALEVSRRLGDQAAASDAIRELGRVVFGLGQVEEGLRLLDEACEIARQSGSTDREVESLLAKGAVLRDQGQYKLALAAIESAQARSTGRVPGAVAAAMDEGTAHALEVQGRYPEAAEAYTRAREKARERGHLPAVASLTLALGAVLMKVGDHDRARREFEDALDQERRLGRHEGIVACLESLALLRAYQGRYEAALETVEDALRVARRASRRDLVARTLDLAGSIHLRLGDLERATPCLDEARRLVKEGSSPRWHAQLLLDLGDLKWLAGEAVEARRLYQESAFLTRKVGDRRLESVALSRLGLAHLREKDHDRALVACRKALALVEDRGLPREEADVRLLQARIELSRPGGDMLRAEMEAVEALRLYRQIREPEQIWQAEHLAGKAAARLGRREEALTRIERAHRYVEGIRSGLVPRRQQTFLADPRRAELYEDWERLRTGAVRTQEAQTQGTGELTRLREEAVSLRRLLEINRTLNSTRDTDALLRAILNAAAELTRAERGFVLLREGSDVTTRCSRGAETDAPGGEGSRPSRSIVRRALESGEAVLLTDVEADEKLEASASVRDLGIRSVLAVPLRIRDEVAGVVYLDSRLDRGLFTPVHLDIASRLADQAGIALDTARLVAEIEQQKGHLERLNAQLERTLETERTELATAREELLSSRSSFEIRFRFEDLVGGSPGMQRLYHLIERLAPKKLPVLVVGESGTGKELIARALHRKGDRSGGPFFTVNCAALPEPLLESELFGYKRGAFTGAERDKPGYFTLAHGGTLFLDEIGEMGPAMQAKLLRAVQDGEVLPVGGKSPFKVDVRIVSATHRDLAGLVREGKFREDLFYRIHVARLDVPPLRERREDIPLLVNHFLGAIAEEDEKPERTVEPEALRYLLAYDWPGNVRELQHVILRVSAFARGPSLTLRDLRAHGDLPLATGAGTPAPGPPIPGAEVESLGQLERKQIALALEKAGGNKTRAAEILGINRATLFRKLRRLDLGH